MDPNACWRFLSFERNSPFRVEESEYKGHRIGSNYILAWHILGVLNIEGEKFIALVTERQIAAIFKGRSIYEITEVRLIPFFPPSIENEASSVS